MKIKKQILLEQKLLRDLNEKKNGCTDTGSLKVMVIVFFLARVILEAYRGGCFISMNWGVDGNLGSETSRYKNKANLIKKIIINLMVYVLTSRHFRLLWYFAALIP